MCSNYFHSKKSSWKFFFHPRKPYRTSLALTSISEVIFKCPVSSAQAPLCHEISWPMQFSKANDNSIHELVFAKIFVETKHQIFFCIWTRVFFFQCILAFPLSYLAPARSICHLCNQADVLRGRVSKVLDSHSDKNDLRDF